MCSQCGARLRKAAPSAKAEGGGVAPASAPPTQGDAGGGDALVDEIRGIRRTLEEILAVLRLGPVRPAPAGELAPELRVVFPELGAEEEAPPPPPARTTRRRQKTVLLIDDDDEARQAAAVALQQAQIPVRTVADGNAGIGAIATEKPDVLVIELALSGPMAGKDVINMIKATMEWVDIPILAYTRLPIASQKEARTIHGADDYLPKGSGSTEALVSRVIRFFQTGSGG